MENARQIIELYFLWGALAAAWMVARTIHKLPALGLVRYTVIMTVAYLAWPQFIFGKWIR